MQVFRFHRSQTNNFDEQQINMVYQQENYEPFLHRSFSMENIGLQMHGKAFSADARQRLVTALKKQYAGLDVSGEVGKNIEALANDDTYTVTTGHQLSLMTGPLYFVIKILHTIRLSEMINENYPEERCVPVFWMASEDHDFEEIRSLNLFGRTMTWNTDQKGPVGRFNLEGWSEVRAEIEQLFANHPNGEIHALLDAFDGENLAEATRKLVHTLFREYGLVIINGDDPSLKSAFAGVIRRELEEGFSCKEVLKTSEMLKREGGKIQVNPREINLFYIQDGLRSRIELHNDGYQIDGVGERSTKELLEELDAHPERFSPNVILRPLYQEMILPNLAYVGGLGEIAYWLQLKGVFDAAECRFPLLSVRNSVLWIDASVAGRMDKVNLHLEDIFHPTDQIKRNFVMQQEVRDLNLDALDEAGTVLANVMDDLVREVDPGKLGFAESEKARLKKQVDAFRDKVIRFAKSRHEDAMSHIDVIRERLCPGNGLQERKVNFFTFCPDGNYTQRLRYLYRSLDPFDGDFIVIRES